jgi:hypothetical protein
MMLFRFSLMYLQIIPTLKKVGINFRQVNCNLFHIRLDLMHYLLQLKDVLSSTVPQQPFTKDVL